MTCEEARIGLYALLDGELDVGSNVEVLGHLEHCAACQEECELDSRLKALVHDELTAAAVAPAELWPAIRERIRREPTAVEAPRPVRWGQAGLRFPRRRIARVASAAAAILLVGLAIGYLRSAPGTAFVVEEIVMDHLHSVLRAQGPVDIASADPAVIVDRLRHDLPGAQVPSLGGEGVRLLGGSVCELPSTRGIRITYTGHDRTVSYYQLERTPRTTFPRPGAARVYVGYADARRGPGALVWGDEHYLYALVAELPAESLEELAARL